MSLSQLVLVLLLVIVTLALAVGAAVAVHRRPTMQAPLTVAFGAVSVVAVVLGVLVAVTR
ncbi:hypothetical protein [Streptomyces sp. NBC_01361]|uniref:hypothetical protein n=1 Tax=Streptomyces sp. NBC_01361 TaxID=2903838 RepID=UPI002E314890|nr:hypothetical protein [Streptomyces sp. NBC_01361]